MNAKRQMIKLKRVAQMLSLSRKRRVAILYGDEEGIRMLLSLHDPVVTRIPRIQSAACLRSANRKVGESGTRLS